MPLSGVVGSTTCETGGEAIEACPATGLVQAATSPAPITSAMNRYGDLMCRS
jgi:hypothetical protein